MNEYPEPVSANTTESKPPRKPRKPRKPMGVMGIAIFAVLASLGLGMASGYAVGYNGSPEPEIRTETVEKEVKVEVEVEVPVDECSALMDSAEAMRKKLVEGFEYAGEYPELIGDAYEAGRLADDAKAEKVISTTSSLNDGLNVVSEELAPIMSKYNEDLVDCSLVG